jgi:hypothetical protein
MIHLVDKILRLGLLEMVPGLTTQQIGFQPPDADWRLRVGTVQGVSLNVYLAEIAEDRALRTNARHVEIQNGVAFSSPAPERIRLHYAISAWSYVKDALQVAATETEHALLGAVLAGLYEAAPINATRLLPYAEVIALPEELQGDLPTQIAPPDGFPRLAEFWGTMGRPQAWKPVVNLVVTAPIVRDPQHVGGIVDTILLDYGIGSDPIVPATVEERLLVVGGVVLDGRPPHNVTPVPVARAVVELRRQTGEPLYSVTSTTDGQFVFDALAPGTYQLGFAAAGIAAAPPVLVTVPLPAGPVRLVFA